MGRQNRSVRSCKPSFGARMPVRPPGKRYRSRMQPPSADLHFENFCHSLATEQLARGAAKNLALVQPNHLLGMLPHEGKIMSHEQNCQVSRLMEPGNKL